MTTLNSAGCEFPRSAIFGLCTERYKTFFEYAAKMTFHRGVFGGTWASLENLAPTSSVQCPNTIFRSKISDCSYRGTAHFSLKFERIRRLGIRERCAERRENFATVRRDGNRMFELRRPLIVKRHSGPTIAEDAK